MIEGIKIDIASAELREHLLSRATHHGERADFYTNQVNNLSAGLKSMGLEGEAEAGAYSNSITGGDPRQTLSRNADNHRNQQTYFKFLSDHIVYNETYRIDESEFRKLEF